MLNGSRTTSPSPSNLWRLTREAVTFGLLALLPVVAFHAAALTFC